jgi:hypothetical protein
MSKHISHLPVKDLFVEKKLLFSMHLFEKSIKQVHILAAQYAVIPIFHLLPSIVSLRSTKFPEMDNQKKDLMWMLDEEMKFTLTSGLVETSIKKTLKPQCPKFNCSQEQIPTVRVSLP